VHAILTSLKQLASIGFQALNHCFLDWAKPASTSLLLGTVTDLARSTSELVAANALLRQQLILLRRQVKRPACTRTDRMLLVLLARMARTWKQALFIIQPETLLRWHRQGFKPYWKYKSRAASAKPKISAETVAFIKEMAGQNRRWGAERIRGEFLKLGIHVSKRTIQKYMGHTRTPRRAGQNWATFLRNHAKDMWACDALAGYRPLLSLAGRPSS
jgi:putative transposase